MATFSRNACAAITWTPEGRCWGVHLKRRGDRCVVALFWQTDAGGDESLAAGLAEGVRCLGASANVPLVVGGAGSTCGLRDLDIPALAPDDERHALEFELLRVAPVSADELVWGYRHLPGGPEGRQRVRVYYLKRSAWDRWINEVGALGRGVDAVIPAPAVLDPLFTGDDVYMPDPRGDGGYRFAHRDEGARQTVRCPVVEDSEVFGALPEPLACGQLRLGGLGSMSAREQQGYLSAVLLGMYGMTSALTADSRGAIPLPYDLRPRRHRWSRFLAAALLVYLAAVAGLAAFRAVSAYRGRTQVLRRQRRELLARLESLGGAPSAQETKLAATLKEEIPEAIATYFGRPTLSVALAELTELIGEDAWCQQLQWTDGNLVVQLLESKEDLSLAATLEGSPVLGDVVQTNRQPAGESVRRIFQLTARYDTERERTRVMPTPVRTPVENDPALPTPEVSPGADPPPSPLRRRAAVPPPPAPPAAPIGERERDPEGR